MCNAFKLKLTGGAEATAILGDCSDRSRVFGRGCASVASLELERENGHFSAGSGQALPLSVPLLCASLLLHVLLGRRTRTARDLSVLDEASSQLIN